MGENENINLSQLKEYADIVNNAMEPREKRTNKIIIALIAVIAVMAIGWTADHMYLTYESFKPIDAKIAVEQDFDKQTQTYENFTGEGVNGAATDNN